MSNILSKVSKAVQSIKEGKKIDVKDVDKLLKNYCENPETEGKTNKLPEFVDPVEAAVLGDEYRKQTGVDHPNIIEHQLGVIKGLIEDKKGDKEYQQKLREIAEKISQKGFLRPDENGIPVPVDIKKEGLLEPQRFDGSTLIPQKKGGEER